MREKRICTKCGSSDILRVRGTVGAYGAGNNIIMVGATIFSAIPVHRYVCCCCGFVEEWVDEKDLADMKAKYIKNKGAK